MPLTPSTLNCVVRIKSAGAFRGSGFIVSVPGEHGRSVWRYLVTAHHVIRGHESLIEVEVPNPNVHPWELYPPVRVTDWRQPIEHVDLAIAPLITKETADRVVGEIEFDENIIPAKTVPYLGAQIYYLGIFQPTAEADGTPMARSGTLGAINVPIRTQEENEDRPPPPYAYVGHYVDCRSYEGFSGSPCFEHQSWSRTDLAGFPRIGPRVMKQLRSADAPNPTFAEQFHMVTLCGMFTAHFSDAKQPEGAVSHLGVGVMLSHEYIREALMSDEAKQERRMWDDIVAKRQAAEGVPLVEASRATPDPEESEPQSEFGRFEDLLRQLVNTPKPAED